MLHHLFFVVFHPFYPFLLISLAFFIFSFCLITIPFFLSFIILLCFVSFHILAHPFLSFCRSLVNFFFGLYHLSLSFIIVSCPLSSFVILYHLVCVLLALSYPLACLLRGWHWKRREWVWKRRPGQFWYSVVHQHLVQVKHQGSMVMNEDTWWKKDREGWWKMIQDKNVWQRARKDVGLSLIIFFWSFVSLSYPPLSFLILYCPFVSFVILYPPLLSFHTLYHPLLSFIIPAFSLIAFSGSSFSFLSYPLSQHNLPSLFHSPLVPSLFTNTVHIYT